MVMDMKLLVRLVILLPFLSTWVSAEYTDQSRSEIEKEILKDIYLASKFHMFIRPERPSNGSHDGPVDVHITMYVLNIDVDTIKQEYNIQMYFRQEWNDSRVTYNGRGKVDFLSSHDTTGLWTPDLFFVNEKSGHFHAITRPNVFLRIYPDGKVFYSQRLSMTLSCPMNLQKYPFDRQICSMPIESYGYTMKDIRLEWKPDVEEKKPVGGTSGCPGFTVSYYSSNSVEYVGNNQYSRAVLDIYLTRLPFGHIFHIYMPIILLVMVSWVTFYMSADSLIPRLTTSIITAVCTLLQLYSKTNLFVTASYPTALDYWVVVSTICVFLALFENIYVSCDKRNCHDSGIAISPESGLLNAAGAKLLESKKNDGEHGTVLKLLVTKLSYGLRTIDVAARIFLPAFFVLFNVIYFIKLTLLSENEPLPKGY